MSTLTLAAGRPTLADRLVSRGPVTDLLLIAGGAGVTAIAAQVTIPLWPVPVTGQSFAVLIVGIVLGATRGAVAIGLYLVLGLVGLPVFGDGRSASVLSSPAGGYLIGFLVAAAVAGWCAQRGCDHGVLKAFTAFLLGTAAVYAVGLPWLYVSLVAAGADHPVRTTLQSGLLPFLVGDLAKAALAGALLPLAWRGVRRADAALASEDMT